MRLRQLFQIYRDLDLPRGQVMIVGSGALAAYGLLTRRQPADFDILVTPEIFQEFCLRFGPPTPIQTGQYRGQVLFIDLLNEPGIQRNELDLTYAFPMAGHDTKTLFERGIHNNGILFMHPTDVVHAKANIGRAKDKCDIQEVMANIRRSHVIGVYSPEFRRDRQWESAASSNTVYQKLKNLARPLGPF